MIKVRNLSFQYPNSNRYALRDVSFDITSGSFVAIIGHNGSGKSTLSKLLLRTYLPTAGDITINNKPLSRALAGTTIGAVFQNPDNQFVGCTVEDDIAFGLENKLMDPEDIHKTILEISKMVGMERFLEWEPQNLSGGQKQRVAIASVLSLDPEIIIFDEVTSMLDPKGKSEVLNLMCKIKEERQKTLISITHDMDEAVHADWVLVFSGGTLIAQGLPSDILSNDDIIKTAHIDKPFVYKVSEKIKGMKPTHNVDDLIDYIKNNAADNRVKRK